MDNNIRPSSLAEYVGQDQLKRNLQRALDGAKARSEPLDHTLVYGPPGLGKTTLAAILANEMGGKLVTTASTALQQANQLVGILRSLTPNTVLFVDEIHRLPAKVEEILYPAMEDGRLDVNVGTGVYARMLHQTLPPFTVVGATTHLSKVSEPLRDRFGLVYRLEYYSHGELAGIVDRTMGVLGATITPDACNAIASRARGTARVANRLCRRVRDYSQAITLDVVEACMVDLGIDTLGLDAVDRRLLHTLVDRYGGGPVGVMSLANEVGEDEDTIQDVYEPYLLRLDFINRTPRGRIITQAGAEYISSRTVREAA